MGATGNDRRIDNIEFNVSDIARSRDFYGKAFGWSFTEYGPSYCEFTDGRLTGGSLTLGRGQNLAENDFGNVPRSNVGAGKCRSDRDFAKLVGRQTGQRANIQILQMGNTHGCSETNRIGDKLRNPRRIRCKRRGKIRQY